MRMRTAVMMAALAVTALPLGDEPTARGESLTAFDGRCIPAGCVAPPANTPGILGRRALAAGRLARLDATSDFHHGLLSAQKPIAITVYKTATCGCCAKWVDHLRANGFAPDVTNLTDLVGIKAKYKVPAEAESCHTAIVNGYVVEGHVPASEIHKLLKQRPVVLGLAAPKMPIGSPGMEGPGAKPYDVVTFDKTGKLKVFSTQGR